MGGTSGLDTQHISDIVAVSLITVSLDVISYETFIAFFFLIMTYIRSLYLLISHEIT